MPAEPNVINVPSENPGNSKKTASLSTLLHEIRIASTTEIRQGRNLVIAMCIFLLVFAAACLAYDIVKVQRMWIAIQSLRMFVSLVLVICLLRSLPKVRFFTAGILGLFAISSLGLTFHGLSHSDISMVSFSAVGFFCYSLICILLLTSSNVRVYLGYRRAKTRNRREKKERQNLHKMMMYQTAKNRLGG